MKLTPEKQALLDIILKPMETWERLIESPGEVENEGFHQE